MSINDKCINTYNHKLKKIPNLLKLKRKWMYKASCKYNMGLIIIKGHSCSFVYDKKGMYYKINRTTNANVVLVEAKKKKKRFQTYLKIKYVFLRKTFEF